MHERETSVSTLMGNLLAIPHGTNEAKSPIRQTAISFVRYRADRLERQPGRVRRRHRRRGQRPPGGAPEARRRAFTDDDSSARPTSPQTPARARGGLTATSAPETTAPGCPVDARAGRWCMPSAQRSQARTASTRRLSSAASGRSSLVKMLLVCLATAFSEKNRAAAIGGVRAALGHQRQHVLLPRSEAIERLLPLVRHDRAITSGSMTVPPATTRRTPSTNSRDVGDAVLEQVAHAAFTAGQELAGVELLDVLREHHHRVSRAGPRGWRWPLAGPRR